MGVIAQTIRSAAASVPLPRGEPKSYWGYGGFSTGGSSRFRLPDEKDYRALIGDGSGTSLITAILNWYARNVIPARQTLVYRDPGSVVGRVVQPEELEYAAVDLLRYPTRDRMAPPQGFITGAQMTQAAAFSWVMDGNVYRWKIRSPERRVVMRWWLPHWCVEPLGGNGNFIESYRYTVDGETHYLSPLDVDHLRFGLDPKNPRKGLSPIRGVLREIYTDEEAARFTAALFANLAFPGAVVIPGKDVVIKDKTARDEIRDTFDNRFKGDGRGRSIVLNANAEVKFLQWSPQELSLADLRDVPEERVSAVNGIPAAVLGFGTGLQQVKVGATMRELRAQAIEDALIPFLEALALNDTDSLLPEFIPANKLPRYEFDWDLSRMPALSQLQKERAETKSELVNAKIITIDEARTDLGYPPVGDAKGGGFATSTASTTPGNPNPEPAPSGDTPSPEDTPNPDDTAATADGLTLREREVALYAARGYANKQIAGAIGITERTVERHLASTKTKLGLATRAELGAWAERASRAAPADKPDLAGHAIASAIGKQAEAIGELAKATTAGNRDVVKAITAPREKTVTHDPKGRMLKITEKAGA